MFIGSPTATPTYSTAPTPTPTPTPPCIPTMSDTYDKENDVVWHEVREGETLKKIADRYLSWAEYFTVESFAAAIKKANALEDAQIKCGQKIKLPGIMRSEIYGKVPPKPKGFKTHAMYWTGDIAEKESAVRYHIRLLKEAGCNTAFIGFKDYDGLIRADMPGNLPAKEAVTRPVHLQKLLYILRENGIYPVARLTVFRDKHLASQKPDWQLPFLGCGKERGTWMNPAKREVWQYNIEIAATLAAYGIHENLDFFRYPATRCTEIKPDRQELITGFLKTAIEQLTPYGVNVSEDIFGSTVWQGSDETRKITGQDPVAIQKLGHLWIMPYPSLSNFAHSRNTDNEDEEVMNDAGHPYETIDKTWDRLESLFGSDAQNIGLWIQAYPDKNVELDMVDFVFQQLKARYMHGHQEFDFVCWNPEGRYEDAVKGIIKFRRWVEAETAKATPSPRVLSSKAKPLNVE